VLYVQQSLTPDEELIHIGQFHWIYTLKAVLAAVNGLILCIIILIASVYFLENYWHHVTSRVFEFRHDGMLGKIRELHPGIRLAAFFVFLMGLLRFAQMMVVRATTEIAVTTSRIIYKRGLVARYVGEMSVDRIESINVLQTVWGRVFGYGRLLIHGMGVGEVILPPIADPIVFRKAIEKARTT
jgi:hypothetical protein